MIDCARPYTKFTAPVVHNLVCDCFGRDVRKSNYLNIFGKMANHYQKISITSFVDFEWASKVRGDQLIWLVRCAFMSRLLSTKMGIINLRVNLSNNAIDNVCRHYKLRCDESILVFAYSICDIFNDSYSLIFLEEHLVFKLGYRWLLVTILEYDLLIQLMSSSFSCSSL